MLINGIQIAFANLRMAVEASEMDGFISTITSGLADFTTSNLGKVLIAGLGISAGLALAWFGYRWIVKKLRGAMNNGKLG